MTRWRQMLLMLALAIGLATPALASDYYNHTGFPATGAAATSASMRAELDLIAAGFEKLPALSGNGGKAVKVNAGATALTVTTGQIDLGGNFTLSGSSAVTLTSIGATTLTLPLTGTLATLTGSETFTNKILTAPTINGATITGTLTWSPTITGHLLFTDATYDIGASGATRPRDFFLSRNAVIGGTTSFGGNVVSNLLFTDATYDIGASGATRPRDLFLSRNAVFGGSLTLGTDLAIAEGGTGLSAIGDDAVWVGDSATAATARTITNCIDTSGQHLNYTQSSNSFSCGTSAPTAPVFNRVVRTAGDVTTTSTSFVDLTAASITMTTGAFPVKVTLSGSHKSDTLNAYTYITVDIDGTDQGGTSNGLMVQRFGVNGNEETIGLSYLSAALTAASHTFKIRWRVSAGTGTILASDPPYTFTVTEIR